jgi:hypothetical protein
VGVYICMRSWCVYGSFSVSRGDEYSLDVYSLDVVLHAQTHSCTLQMGACTRYVCMRACVYICLRMLSVYNVCVYSHSSPGPLKHIHAHTVYVCV